MKLLFDHEKLNVYQASIRFNEWIGELLASVEGKAAVKDQLDRAATSVPINIAEGNGKFSAKDRARYFDIARGSALESAACLDVLRSRKLATEAIVTDGKGQLVEIVSMLIGLLRRLGYDFDSGTWTSVVREEIGGEQEQEQDKE